MKNEKTEDQSLVVQGGYAGLQNFNMADALQEELAGLDLTFDKIKIPAGGSITFEVPGEDPDSPDVVKEFTGVIVHQHPVRMYYREKYNGSSNPPDCGSFDGIVGIGNPGGNCKTCPFNQYGSAVDDGKGKACKDRRRIYILKKDEMFPLLLSLPTGSLKSLTTYITRLLSKGLRTNLVVTKFLLKKAFNANNIAYSQAVFNTDRELTTDEQTAINRVSEQIKSMSKSVGFELDNIHDSDDDSLIVYPETGEIIEPLK